MGERKERYMRTRQVTMWFNIPGQRGYARAYMQRCALGFGLNNPFYFIISRYIKTVFFFFFFFFFSLSPPIQHFVSQPLPLPPTIAYRFSPPISVDVLHDLGVWLNSVLQKRIDIYLSSSFLTLILCSLSLSHSPHPSSYPLALHNTYTHTYMHTHTPTHSSCPHGFAWHEALAQSHGLGHR